MTLALLALATGALALAGFVQGLTGFGFGMVAMGLLPALLGLDAAQAVVTLTGIVVFVAMTGISLRHVQWAGAAHLWLGTLVGLPLGFLLLVSLPQALMTRVLGLAICLMVLLQMLVSRRSAALLPSWTGWLLGLASGAFSGAFSIGGPPVVIYVFGRPWTKQEQVATLNALFVGMGLIRVALLLTSQILTADVWKSAGCAVGPMLAASLLGSRLLRFVSQRQLRIAVYIALLALGGHYLLAGL